MLGRHTLKGFHTNKNMNLNFPVYPSSGGVGTTAGQHTSAEQAVDDDTDEFLDPEPLPILGRCKAMYPFEGQSK